MGLNYTLDFLVHSLLAVVPFPGSWCDSWALPLPIVVGDFKHAGTQRERCWGNLPSVWKRCGRYLQFVCVDHTGGKVFFYFFFKFVAVFNFACSCMPACLCSWCLSASVCRCAWEREREREREREDDDCKILSQDSPPLRIRNTRLLLFRYDVSDHWSFFNHLSALYSLVFHRVMMTQCVPRSPWEPFLAVDCLSRAWWLAWFVSTIPFWSRCVLPWPKKSLQPRYSWDWSAVRSCDIMQHRLRSATRARDAQCCGRVGRVDVEPKLDITRSSLLISLMNISAVTIFLARVVYVFVSKWN